MTLTSGKPVVVAVKIDFDTLSLDIFDDVYLDDGTRSLGKLLIEFQDQKAEDQRLALKIAELSPHHKETRSRDFSR
jgi:hypothetical protein